MFYSSLWIDINYFRKTPNWERQKHSEWKWKGVFAIRSCCWRISPGCSSYHGAAAAGAGCSPLVEAFSLGSPAASTLCHLACSPCSRAGESTKSHHAYTDSISWQLSNSWVHTYVYILLLRITYKKCAQGYLWDLLHPLWVRTRSFLRMNNITILWY